MGAMRPLLLTVTLALAAQEPTIRVPVRLVHQDVLVFTADNRVIPDLQAATFRVFDNGHPQSFTLDTEPAPVSLVLAVQTNAAVRDYLPFVAKAGSTVEALLAGATGDTALLSYADDVGEPKELRGITAAGRDAHMIDAGRRAAAILGARTPSRRRVLVFIGQPADSGSESDLASLQRDVEREDITVFTITLPMLGKSFVSDTFSLQGVTFAERGGFRAGADLKNLVEVLSHKASAEAGADPFQVLASATGGIQFHVRTQRQLEDAIAAIGLQLRSGYVLSYHPAPAEAGYHTVRIESAISGARIFSRPGYWLAEEGNEPRL